MKSGAASSQRLPAERPIYGTQKLFARSRPTSAPRAPSDVRLACARMRDFRRPSISEFFNNIHKYRSFPNAGKNAVS